MRISDWSSDVCSSDLADQSALGRVEVHHAGGRRLDAHLVLDGPAGDAVARAKGAVFLHQELRHDEQRDTPGALRRIRQLRQHQVDDVLREVVLAGGDEDLGAGDLVASLTVRLGARADEAEVGAAVRLGEAHGARPAAVRRSEEKGPLLRLAAVRSEEHTSELQSLMRISYAVFCLNKKHQSTQQAD